MIKRIAKIVLALTSMVNISATAQTDAGTTTEGVPMVKLNNGVLMPKDWRCAIK